MHIKTKSANFYFDGILIRQLIQFKRSKYRKIHHQCRQYSLNTASPEIDNFQKSIIESVCLVFSPRKIDMQRNNANILMYEPSSCMTAWNHPGTMIAIYPAIPMCEVYYIGDFITTNAGHQHVYLITPSYTK